MPDDDRSVLLPGCEVEFAMLTGSAGPPDSDGSRRRELKSLPIRLLWLLVRASGPCQRSIEASLAVDSGFY